MTIYCPNCGTPNTDTATSCVGCNTELKNPNAGEKKPKFKGTMMMSGVGAAPKPAAPPEAAPPPPATPPAGPPSVNPQNVGYQKTMLGGPMMAPPPAPPPASNFGAPAAPAPAPAFVSANQGGFGATMPAGSDPNFGAPPAPGGFASGGFGANANPMGAGSSPQGGFGAPPQGGGFGAPPAGGGFGAPPQGGFGAPPAGGGFGAPPPAFTPGGVGGNPPEEKKSSVLKWVLIGCGGLTAIICLIFVAVGAWGAKQAKDMQSELANAGPESCPKAVQCCIALESSKGGNEDQAKAACQSVQQAADAPDSPQKYQQCAGMLASFHMASKLVNANVPACQ